MSETKYICGTCDGRMRVGYKQGQRGIEVSCVRCDKSKHIMDEEQVVVVDWDKEK